MKKPLFVLSKWLLLEWRDDKTYLMEVDRNSLADICHRYTHIYPVASQGLTIFIKNKEGRLLRRRGIKTPELK